MTMEKAKTIITYILLAGIVILEILAVINH